MVPDLCGLKHFFFTFTHKNLHILGGIPNMQRLKSVQEVSGHKNMDIWKAVLYIPGLKIYFYFCKPLPSYFPPLLNIFVVVKCVLVLSSNIGKNMENSSPYF